VTLLSILTKNASFKVFVSIVLGSLAGICYALLIPLVTNSFTDQNAMPAIAEEPAFLFGLEVSNYKFALVFFSACVLIFICRTLSQLLLTWIVVDATSALRHQYYDVIIKSPLAQLEQVGFSRLIASVTTDVQRIVLGAQVIPDVLISAVTLFGMMMFLLYLDTDIFIFVGLAIVFGAITFQIPIILGNQFFKRSRERVDVLQESIRGTVFGIKELKLNANRRQQFFHDVLFKAENDVRVANKKGATIIRAAMNYGDMVSFFVIGYVAFIFVNYHSVSLETIVGSVMVLLYITGPMAVLMNSSPDIGLANVSLAKVDKLFKELTQEPTTSELLPLKRWSSLHFRDICYQYDAVEEGAAAGFAVGPLSFTLHKGEITFIVGGNGSGKSTLSKLLTSHYLAHQGDIFLDQQRIDASYIQTYRNQVSAVFTDFHLFAKVLGCAEHWSDFDINRLLKQLKLDHKVTVVNGVFSTLALSDGQRKRLALLVALMEDRDIYLFDEWAADQDPLFKEIFYRTILPELKTKGKVVAVISHDDRYFDVADRILTMEQGRLLPEASHAERRAV
jgi:putative ATP-binding cassette transporter